MSYNNVLHVHDTDALVDYLMHGKGEQRRANLERGTHRMAYLASGAGGLEGFVRYCESVAGSRARKIECHSVVQSFPGREFDPDDPADAERVNRLGCKLAEALSPGSEYVVVTHADTGHLHNHILIANEDGAGRAVTWMSVARVRAANNQIMREEGLEVLNEPCSEWSEKRPRVHSELALFLGDNVDAALRSASNMEEFAEELARRGISIRDRRRNGEPLSGWRYETTRLNDPNGKRKAPRGHKASGLCSAFAKEAVEGRFAAMQPAVPDGRPSAGVPDGYDAELGFGELGEAEARHYLEGLYAEACNRAQRGSGKYAELNREMRSLLADVGHERFRRIVHDLNAETRRRVREVEELDARKRELGERTPAERALASGSRAALAKGDAVAALLMMMWQLWLERQRMMLLAQQEQAVRDARPEKWAAENAENAAARVLDEYEGFARRHELRHEGMEDIRTFGAEPRARRGQEFSIGA